MKYIDVKSTLAKQLHGGDALSSKMNDRYDWMKKGEECRL